MTKKTQNKKKLENKDLLKKSKDYSQKLQKANNKLLQNPHNVNLAIKTNRLENVCNCSNYIENINYLDLENTWNIHNKINSIRCNDKRLCEYCSNIEAEKKAVYYWNVIEYKELQDKHLYFLVFTVKHNKEMTSDFVFEKLENGHKKLIQHFKDIKKDKISKSPFLWIQGGFTSFETTKTSNWYNHHFNLLLITDKPIKDYKELATKSKSKKLLWKSKSISNLWYKMTKDSYIVSIQKIDNLDYKKSIFEICKYSLKFSSFTNKNDFIKVFNTFKGKRLLHSFWCMRFKNDTIQDFKIFCELKRLDNLDNQNHLIAKKSNEQYSNQKRDYQILNKKENELVLNIHNLACEVYNLFTKTPPKYENINNIINTIQKPQNPTNWIEIICNDCKVISLEVKNKKNIYYNLTKPEIFNLEKVTLW